MTTDHLFIRGFANGEPIFYRRLHAGGGEQEAERAEDRLERYPAPGRQGARDLADRGAARLDQRRDQLSGARVR